MAPLVLVGFMGCGKSRVGRCVSGILDRSFVDLDHSVERSAGRTIPQIFATEGESVFRSMETEALARHLQAVGEVVIATGGGAWMVQENRCMVRESGGRSIFIDVPWTALLERISRHPERRPLFDDAASAERLFRQRLPSYRTADVLVQTDGYEPAENVAMRVVRRIREVE